MSTKKIFLLLVFLFNPNKRTMENLLFSGKLVVLWLPVQS